MKSTQPIALITGATRGLGLAMARNLVAQGYQVVSWDVSTESAFRSESFHTERVDVSDREAVEGAARALSERFSAPQLLVNNAGLTRDALFHKMTAAQIDEAFKVNLYGTMYVSQAVGGLMREANSSALKAGGRAEFRRILMISSAAGVHGNVGQANYAAAKAGVIGLAKTLAKEWGRFNIGVAAVAPGLMNTEMVRTIPEPVLKSMVDRTPLGRMGEPDELAALVAFLARPESAFLTGDVLNFAGGLLL